LKLTTADYAHRFLLRCSDTFSAYCFLGSSLRLYGSDAFSQSLERVNARQRPRHGNVRDETRRFARSARTRETRRVDSLDDEHQTSLQKRTFFYSIFMVRRVQTRPSTASLERVRSPETTRRDTQPSWSGHTDLDHARDATEGIDARTHDVFGACILHARVCVTVTSRRRLTLGVVE